MARGSFSSVTDQVVELLRDGMFSGRWKGVLAGRDRLADELGVSHTTVETAMRRLAKEGLLVSEGAGRRRRIALPRKPVIKRCFLVRILLYESTDGSLPYFSDMLERLRNAGLSADLATKALVDLGMNVKRVARFVKENPADAWVVGAGSREVLKWFSEQAAPAYAFFNVRTGVPIAGCGVRYDFDPLIQQLTELGHRRIVMLAREEHIAPQPSSLARDFLESLQRANITAGPFNLPQWGYQPEGLLRCLESLFKVTPPTALVAAEPQIMLAARDYLTRRGIITPQDVSLICLYHDPAFLWLDPPTTHYTFDHRPANQRIASWAGNVSRGRKDVRQTMNMARLVEGGTLGPAKLSPRS